MGTKMVKNAYFLRKSMVRLIGSKGNRSFCFEGVELKRKNNLGFRPNSAFISSRFGYSTDPVARNVPF